MHVCVCVQKIADIYRALCVDLLSRKKKNKEEQQSGTVKWRRDGEGKKEIYHVLDATAAEFHSNTAGIIQTSALGDVTEGSDPFPQPPLCPSATFQTMRRLQQGGLSFI